MRTFLAVAALALLSLPSLFMAQQTAPTAEIVSAANSFLATLSAEQHQKVFYAFDDASQRARWSNLPTGFVPRGGISLKQMSAPQRNATMKLLATVLSPMGLEKVNEIREADDDFKANGSKRGPGGRGGPPPGGTNGPPQNGPPPQFGGPGGTGGPGRGRPPLSARKLLAALTISAVGAVCCAINNDGSESKARAATARKVLILFSLSRSDEELPTRSSLGPHKYTIKPSCGRRLAEVRNSGEDYQCLKDVPCAYTADTRLIPARSR
jgi:Protein of unknown function (DUF3500)